VRGPPGAGLKTQNWGHLLGHTIACADRRAALAWLNSPAVRAAIGAAPEAVAGGWTPCSDRIDYEHDTGSMLPVHAYLLSPERRLRALIYSGDHDYVVPFTGTRAWVYGLGLPVSAPWHAWSDEDGQTLGFAAQFDAGRLTFATVKGGAHMVPQRQPREALLLLRIFLAVMNKNE
jgi:serine carboxypeptidase-like clade 1